ncbi:MAG: hypothetical protein ACYDD2_06330 [Candidatus Acidiferrales bacterium]
MYSEQSLRSRICLEADSAIIEDHNAVERVVKNGPELALCRLELSRGLVLLSSRKNQKTSMEENGGGEGDQNGKKQNCGKISARRSDFECRSEQSDDRQGEESKPGPPALTWAILMLR